MISSQKILKNFSSNCLKCMKIKHMCAPVCFCAFGWINFYIVCFPAQFSSFSTTNIPHAFLLESYSDQRLLVKCFHYYTLIALKDTTVYLCLQHKFILCHLYKKIFEIHWKYLLFIIAPIFLAVHEKYRIFTNEVIFASRRRHKISAQTGR